MDIVGVLQPQCPVPSGITVRKEQDIVQWHVRRVIWTDPGECGALLRCLTEVQDNVTKARLSIFIRYDDRNFLAGQ